MVISQAKSQITRIIRGFSTYLLASIINKALPFFLLPVLTRYLSPTEYGVLAIYQVLITFFTPVIGLNMQNNITRSFFRQNKEWIGKLICNLIILLMASFSIVLLGLTGYILFFQTGNSNPDNIPNRWLYTVPVIVVMQSINQFNLTILRNQGRALLYGSFEIAETCFNLLITLLLIIVYQKGWEGRAFGILISVGIFGLISLTRIYRAGFLKLNFNWEQIKESLIITFPLGIYAFGTVIVDMSDRLFIDHMLGKEAVGLYTVGYQFGMIILLFTDAFNKTWSPWMYKQLANITETKKEQMVFLTYIYDIGLFLMALIISGMSIPLIRIMTTEKYYSGQQYVIWVALGYAVKGMYAVLLPYLVHEGKTAFLGWITIFTAAINLIANYWLITLHGPIGAAQATLLSYSIAFFLVWWYTNKVYPMPWKINNIRQFLSDKKNES